MSVEAFVCILESNYNEKNKNDEAILYAIKVWYTQRVLCDYQGYDFKEMLFRVQEIQKKWEEVEGVTLEQDQTTIIK